MYVMCVWVPYQVALEVHRHFCQNLLRTREWQINMVYGMKVAYIEIYVIKCKLWKLSLNLHI